MNYGKIDFMSIVDGDGCRVTLFVSGCRNHCPGCFNEATWDFSYGKEFTEIEANEIIEACRKPYIAGITVLGGEPMEEENQPAVLELLRKFRAELPEKNIWLYTGYVMERDLYPGGRKHVPGVTGPQEGWPLCGRHYQFDSDSSLRPPGTLHNGELSWTDTLTPASNAAFLSS